MWYIRLSRMFCSQRESSWVFSVVAAVKGLNKIKTGKLVSLSEQELVDCDVRKHNQGCSGGAMDTAFSLILHNGGITSESNYPYRGWEGSCDETRLRNHVATISGYSNVPMDEEEGRERGQRGVSLIQLGETSAVFVAGYYFHRYSMETLFASVHSCCHRRAQAVAVSSRFVDFDP
ncbi:cysteine endopeptidase RepA-like [Syzygium oleosum]|uniref:cysteine endopeptidase RepA-like n=1 Tax=Syzygium oleosum TaxID=219896 RepID=UPI0024B9C176|nr:cysteine endopeptidase RepA-like [Syzygium oleosum]